MTSYFLHICEVSVTFCQELHGLVAVMQPKCSEGSLLYQYNLTVCLHELKPKLQSIDCCYIIVVDYVPNGISSAYCY